MLPTHAWNIATMNDRWFGAYFSKVAEIPVPQFPTSQVYALGGRTLFWDATSPCMPGSVVAEWPVSIKEMSLFYEIAEKAMNASFDLAVNARVVEVLMEKDRAIGVKVMTPDKKSHLIKAKHVILSASTLGSTQILLNSDIKGRAIGHFLAGHSRVMAAGVVNRSEFPENLGPLHILVPGAASRPYQSKSGDRTLGYSIKRCLWPSKYRSCFTPAEKSRIPV